MTNEIKIFPNIPVSHWIKLRQQFKRSIPGSVSINYLSTVLGISETSAKVNTLPTLKLINLVDEKGNTNQELAKKFRDDLQYKSFCKDLLEANYPLEVRDVFPDTNVERDKVKSWFMNHSGVGDSAAQRFVAFYFILLEANPNPESSGLTTHPPDSKKIPSIVKKAEKKAVTAKQEKPRDEESHEKIEEGKGKDHNFPGLNINIQIHISSDATPDQIEKIFEAMSKHIYKNK
ncbi:MAG: hypothetical protein NT175_08970 [Bacteroidetes bacterium]|nr:hypothetical protein [Bacteroidota bacterium]